MSAVAEPRHSSRSIARSYACLHYGRVKDLVVFGEMHHAVRFFAQSALFEELRSFDLAQVACLLCAKALEGAGVTTLVVSTKRCYSEPPDTFASQSTQAAVAPSTPETGHPLEACT